jgi:hypothetical protein
LFDLKKVEGGEKVGFWVVEVEEKKGSVGDEEARCKMKGVEWAGVDGRIRFTPLKEVQEKSLGALQRPKLRRPCLQVADFCGDVRG